MRREFCVVQECTDEYMVLRNVYDELYYIEPEWNAKYSTGDEVVLVYSERTEVEPNTFTAIVKELKPDNSTVSVYY